MTDQGPTDQPPGSERPSPGVDDPGEGTRPDPVAQLDLEAVVARIRARVAERRAEGWYPEGMEDQLDRHYQELLFSQATDHSAVRRLHESVRQLDQLPPFSRSRIEHTSRTRGGRLFHRVWGALSSRQTEGILAQARTFSDAVTRLADRMAEVVEALALHGHPDTERRVGALADRLSLLEDVAARLDHIELELAELRAEHPADRTG